MKKQIIFTISRPAGGGLHFTNGKVYTAVDRSEYASVAAALMNSDYTESVISFFDDKLVLSHLPLNNVNVIKIVTIVKCTSRNHLVGFTYGQMYHVTFIDPDHGELTLVNNSGALMRLPPIYFTESYEDEIARLEDRVNELKEIIIRDNTIRMGDKYECISSGVKYVVVMISVNKSSLWVLANIACGSSWSDAAADVNDIFGGHRQGFAKII